MNWPRASIHRPTLLALLAIVVALGFFAFDSVVHTVGVGHFPLQVTLLGTEDPDIAEVAVETFSSKDYAEHSKIDPRRLDLHPEPVDWSDGDAFIVPVRCSERR